MPAGSTASTDYIKFFVADDSTPRLLELTGEIKKLESELADAKKREDSGAVTTLEGQVEVARKAKIDEHAKALLEGGATDPRRPADGPLQPQRVCAACGGRVCGGRVCGRVCARRSRRAFRVYRRVSPCAQHLATSFTSFTTYAGGYATKGFTSCATRYASGFARGCSGPAV